MNERAKRARGWICFIINRNDLDGRIESRIDLLQTKSLRPEQHFLPRKMKIRSEEEDAIMRIVQEQKDDMSSIALSTPCSWQKLDICDDSGDGQNHGRLVSESYKYLLSYFCLNFNNTGRIPQIMSCTNEMFKHTNDINALNI